MNQTPPVNRELVSALADGQLRGEDFAQVVAALLDSEDAVAEWHAYHVVGDALRCADLADCRDDLAFVARLRKRLPTSMETRPAQERATDAEVSGWVPSPFKTEVPSSAFLGRNGANDPVRRWKLFAGVASMAAVAAIGWHLLDGVSGPASIPQLAVAPDAGAGMPGPAVMLRDARLDELLAAHKQFGGTSALQMPAGFLRNATFENPSR